MANCTKCGRKLPLTLSVLGVAICEDCAQQSTVRTATEPPANDAGASPTGRRFTRRYADAYATARAIVAFGSTIKAIGAVLGVLVALVGLAGGGRGFILGAVAGGFVALVMYVAGVVASAQGQLLLAALDTAVNTSPFMEDAEKLAILN